jgi:trehalose-6-phosphatase
MQKAINIIDAIRPILFGSGKPLFLVFDRDGTLVPFADEPEDAVFSDSVRESLYRLAEQPGVSVGVLSARSTSKLRSDCRVGE